MVLKITEWQYALKKAGGKIYVKRYNGSSVLEAAAIIPRPKEGVARENRIIPYSCAAVLNTGSKELYIIPISDRLIATFQSSFSFRTVRMDGVFNLHFA